MDSEQCNLASCKYRLSCQRHAKEEPPHTVITYKNYRYICNASNGYPYILEDDT